jgi:hypothetical protein
MMSDAPLYYIIRMTVPQDAGNPETFDVATKLTTLTVAGFSCTAKIVEGFNDSAAGVDQPDSYSFSIAGTPGSGAKINAAIPVATEIDGAIVASAGLVVEPSLVLVIRTKGQPSSSKPLAILPVGSQSQTFSVNVTEFGDIGAFTMDEVLAYFAEMRNE